MMSQRNQQQKAEELRQLNRFKSLFLNFPNGEIKSDYLSKQKGPDFIIDTGNRIIGIELTDLCHPREIDELPLRSQENLRDQIMDDAGNLYSKYGLNPIQVSVFFNQQCVLKKRDKKRLSNAIVDIVIQNLPLDGHCLVLEYDCDNTKHFPEEIFRIRIWNTSDIERSFFFALLLQHLFRLSRLKILCAHFYRRNRKLNDTANVVKRYGFLLTAKYITSAHTSNTKIM